MSTAAVEEKPRGARFEETIEEQQPERDALAPTITQDTEKAGSSRYADSEAGVFREENRKAERKLMFKLDIVILPLAVLLYLSAYLDRGNLGNARLQGLEANVLGGDDQKYSLALACFFISYIVLSIPGTLLAKAIDPSISIAFGALTWSIAAMMQAFAYNPTGLYICRIFVGVGEACFGQAMALYFSYWYRKDEIAKRVGLFISAGAVSGAFGGLISFGVSSIQSASIAQYRILFLIEGAPSVLLAIIIFFFLPSRPQTSRYLNENERTLALTRLNADSLGEGNTGIDVGGLKRAFLDWKTYVVALMYSCMNLGLGSVGGFLPTIIKGLGYSAADAQLYTVPPYVVALVFMLLLTSYSDRVQSRGIPIMSVFVIGIVGWAILLGVNPVGADAGALKVRYFGCICVVVAGYTNIPLIIGWQSNNTGSQTQRAVSLGMLNTVGQCLSVLASYSFPTAEAPKWVKGIALNIAFSAFGFFLALGMTLFYRWENKRRDKKEGGRPAKGTRLDVVELHDLAPGFRYVP